MKKQVLLFILIITLVLSTISLTSCHKHQFGEWEVTIQPTCTQDGQRQRSCTCGEKQNESIPATGHNFVGNVCTNCSACYEHQFGEWEVTIQPTCTQDGQRQRSCTCGEKQNESIPATGHNFVGNV